MNCKIISRDDWQEIIDCIDLHQIFVSDTFGECEKHNKLKELKTKISRCITCHENASNCHYPELKKIIQRA